MCRLLNRVPITSQRVPPLFSLEDFPKKCQISICLTTKQFSTLLQAILNELWLRVVGTISGSYSYYMAISLHDGVLTWIFGWHGKSCSQTVSFGGIPEPMQGCRSHNQFCHLRVKKSLGSFLWNIWCVFNVLLWIKFVFFVSILNLIQCKAIFRIQPYWM